LLVLNEHGYINRVDPGVRRFLTLAHNAYDPHSLPQAPNYDVWMDIHGKVWVNAGGYSMSRYDGRADSLWHTVKLPGDLKFWGICCDCDNTVWIPGEGYVTQFDPASEKLVDQINVNGYILNGLCDRTNSSILWFESINEGLVRIDKRTRRVRYFTPKETDATSIGSIQTRILGQDADGIIWLSAFGVGLQLFDPRSEKVKGTYAPSCSITGNPSAYFRDRKGRCWVAFQNAGPALFDPATGRFTSFETIAGCPWPVRGSTGMIADRAGNLWISGNGSGQIVRFNPDTRDVRIYTQTDGVAPGTAATRSSSPVALPDGSFWFSGMGGVTRFFPSRVNDNQYLPPVYITQLTQAGVPIPLATSVEGTTEIVLPPERNYFEFEATALNYRLPSMNRYQFRLIGLDNGWRDEGTQRRGYYTGLGEGMYILEVRGSNNDGLWSKQPARLKIYVRPEVPKDARQISLDEIKRGQPIAVGVAHNTLFIETVPLDFSVVADGRFSYMLDGYDPSWIPVVNKRYVAYNKVPDGKYEFRLRDSETGEAWSLPIRVLAPFYRSWWFFALAGLAVVAIAGTILLIRFSYLRSKQEEELRHHREEQELVRQRAVATDERLKAVVAREKAVEAQQESETRQKNLVETMTEGFVIMADTDVLTYANTRFCQMVGHDFDEIIGKPVANFLDEPNQKAFVENLHTKNIGEMFPYELQWLRADGELLTTLVSPRKIVDSTGVYKETFAVITDISELKKTEGILLAREQELVTEKQSLDEMNTALKVLLQKREEDIDEVKARLKDNIQILVDPYVEKMRGTELDIMQQEYINIIASQLSDIASDFSKQLGTKYAELTYTELQIVNLVREGKSTKEIADILRISERTVDAHRGNIRKKLGLVGDRSGLKSYLQQLKQS